MDSHRSSLLVPRPSSPSLRPPPPRGYEAFGGQDGYDNGPCDQLLLFFSDIPRALCLISSIIALIVIIVIVTLAEAVHSHGECDVPASSPQTSSQQQTACGTSGVDLSSLSASDLNWRTGHWSVWLRPCGSVASTLCPAGSQGCLLSDESQSIDFGPYIAGSGVWSSPQSGVVQYSLTSSSSSLCDSSPYTLLLSFHCLQTASSPSIFSLTLPYSCHFAVGIHTDIACATGQQPAAAAGSSRQQSLL